MSDSVGQDGSTAMEVWGEELSGADAISAFAVEAAGSANDLPLNEPPVAVSPAARPRMPWAPTRHILGVVLFGLVLGTAGIAGYLYSAKPVSLNERVAEVQQPVTPAVEPAKTTADDVRANVTQTPIESKTAVPRKNLSSRAVDRKNRIRGKAAETKSRLAARSVKRPAPRPAAPKMTAAVAAKATTGTSGVVATPEESTALSGEWAMNTRVESSTLKRYEGLHLVYKVELRQHGDRLTGTGVKIRENDRRITTAAQTPIVLEGVVKGDRAELTFTERGRLRPSVGKLVLARESPDVLRGRFSSNAAQSSGDVEIRRP